MNQSLSSGPVFSDDNLINLYHLNELYGNLAKDASRKLNESLAIDVPITSGIWGGTYLIANKNSYFEKKSEVLDIYEKINDIVISEQK